MALDRSDAAMLLPCGRDAVEVWDAASAGVVEEHAANCPYCQEVMAEQAALAATTRALVDEPVEPPDTLVAQVMSSVRLGLRHRAPLRLASPHGPVRVDAGAAARILRHAARDLADVRVRNLAVTPTRSEDDAGPSWVVVTAEVETRAGASVLAAASGLRRVLGDAVTRLVGVGVAGIDIEVVDLFGDLDDAARGSTTDGTVPA